MAIAGGGPAGLAAAIRAAQKGLKTLVIERSVDPPDKACGEGLMPSGARELDALGARISESAIFRGIRYLQEDGSEAQAYFRDGAGIGIRRTALARALRDRAIESGAEIRHAAVQSARASKAIVELATDAGPIEARLAVAADGLHSPLRKAAGLEKKARPVVPRFGIRRHFALAPWSDLVEVHWAPGAEAYVTPVGPRSVNVAFLTGRALDYGELMKTFPKLADRIGDAGAESEARGAGPLLQKVRARCADRLALIGDAAGYVDAITGQGLSLAFHGARVLIELLPRDLSTDLTPALAAYDRALRRPWLRYALPAHALVALSRRPMLRRVAIRSTRFAFSALLDVVG
ncbi:MAG: NAD(P)/FAD-dependent oxidoreductase [Myxococcales bacterium]|nr:NAD(P)/FAD-dependent oxidoreductase [Myxococcales bacterium]